MNKQIPTWQDIEAVVYGPEPDRLLVNPGKTVMHHAISLVRRGDLTQEEALRLAVVALMELTGTQMRQIVDHVMRQPFTPVVLPKE